MSSPLSSFKTIIIIAVLLFVAFLVYMSILGVNNSAHTNLKEFIEYVSERNYTKIKESYTKDSAVQNQSFEEVMQFHFILELALLNHFSLLEDEGYRIEVTRNNMWLPLITPNTLDVSLKLAPVRKATLIPQLFEGDMEPIDALFSVEREDEKWKITEIHIDDSSLAEDFKTIQATIDIAEFIQVTPAGLQLQQAKIELEQLSPLEKRVLVYSLKTALEKIDQGR